MATTWSILNTEYLLSEGGQTNVINCLHWQCVDSDDNGNQGRAYGTVSVPTNDLSSFTPYADVTEAEALQWAFDALGAEQVTAIQDGVAAQLAAQQNPTEGSGTPWG